ncbi:MAG: tRNA preQ1(34) S-adenosylmethionine ribosyltransferase-isomerase QueA [Porphyromonadaceae bacterium]|nr:tRNA preQ1(34) S-adenosylmethionine ribosyltransferase-isomerase QueA [Porphyromonadaceae bacterium]
MKLSQFRFDLPEKLIAQYPSKHRDDCKLLVLHKKSEKVEHRKFADILEYFDDKDLFVFNNTQVFPALMTGIKEKTEAVIEVFLLRELNPDTKLWDVLVDPARKIRVGNKLYFGEDQSLVAEVIDNTTSRGRTLRFLYDGTHEEFKQALFAQGRTSLPPYIKRPVEPADTEAYQTIFASEEGAVVAPFAGLRFSGELMKKMQIKGIDSGFITLHCSLSMFRSIDVEDLQKHKLDSEQMELNEDFVELFNRKYAENRRICAIGTSVLRALETASTIQGKVKEYRGWTNKFIFPPYDFQTVSSVLSTLHLPYSTMLMNKAAFAGYDLMMKTYETAIKKNYKFGCFGDLILILNN